MASLMEALGILSVDEWLQLIDEIWISLGTGTNDQQLTTEQMAELDRRLADAEANPDDVIPWETVRAEIEGKLRH